jgi:hypothetical protein
MVGIAAVLAGVKVLGHRSHNETLQHQIEAGNWRTQADTLHTKAGVERTKAVGARTESSNQWAFYQAKKLRQHFYEVQLEMADLLVKDESARDMAAKWKANVQRYSQDTKEIQEAANKQAELAREYEAEAEKLDHEAKELDENIKEEQEKSHHAHRKSDFYDLGEMGVELALVVCSVAILTRRRGFWIAGLALGAVGAALGLIGLLI